MLGLLWAARRCILHTFSNFTVPGLHAVPVHRHLPCRHVLIAGACTGHVQVLVFARSQTSVALIAGPCTGLARVLVFARSLAAGNPSPGSASSLAPARVRTYDTRVRHPRPAQQLIRHSWARHQRLKLGPAPTSVTANFGGSRWHWRIWQARESRDVVRRGGVVRRLDRFRPMDHICGLSMQKSARDILPILVFHVAGRALCAHPKILPSRLSFGVCLRVIARACIGVCCDASCLCLTLKRLDLQRVLTPAPGGFFCTKREGSSGELRIHVHILAPLR